MNKILGVEQLSLTKRLIILVLVPIILTFALGFLAFKALDKNTKTLNDIAGRTSMLLTAHNLLSNVHSGIRSPIFDIEDGKLTWSDGLTVLTKGREKIAKQFKDFNKHNEIDLHDGDLGAIAARDAMPVFLSAVDDVIAIIKEENHGNLSLFIKEELQERMSPLIKAVTTHQREDIELTDEKISKTLKGTTENKVVILILLAVTLFLLVILGYLVFNSIERQTRSLIATIDELNKGNKDARTTIVGQHELAQLGTALNQLLDERDVTEINIQKENEVLNTSVFSLLESVADLSERNLTVRATVTEDATGPLADAINQLAIDTTDVLKKVRNIARTVEETSQTVDQHTARVKNLAESERLEAEQTSKAVSYLIERLNQIAKSSVSANTIANETTQATEKAYQSVSKTVDSMTDIRGTVQETGKRIKRLGERSQEITHIIDLINTITERTTVLALNASMQALSAGKAGKGFSVIAEEIQRLAESSRESTDQIANLIKNIQQETRTTMSTMDNTIEQVIIGSSLAEEASEQMQLTLNATNKLTHSVESIAQSSKEQVAISNKLRIRTAEILKATQSTGQEMELLSNLTKGMVKNTQILVQSVNVFKLEKTSTPKLLSQTTNNSPKVKSLVSNG
jgi:methyl-accepting chemotaxis protein